MRVFAQDMRFLKVGLLSQFHAERKTSHEKLSFQSRQIGSRIFAETELPSASFFTLLQVDTQFAPAKIIAGSEILGGEALLSGNDSRDDTDGTTYHHTRNGPTSARRSPLMNPCHPKAVFQIIVSPRQSLHVIALKEASSKVVGDVTKMLNGLSERSHLGLVLLHLTHESQVALSKLCPSGLLWIG